LLYDSLVIHEYHLHSWDISEFVAAENKCLYDLYATVNTASADSSTEHKQCNLFFIISTLNYNSNHRPLLHVDTACILDNGTWYVLRDQNTYKLGARRMVVCLIISA
jgi:hypothetical protein